jgi:CubicO group peptidase (beta-lactamase class C family)
MIRNLVSTKLIARLLLLVALATPVAAQQLTPVEQARIDSAALAVLAGTGAPSASVAIVRGGELVYEQAYGEGRVGTWATTGMRYAIGSVSKQFTATAILLLAEEGKLSLDDTVARWFPRLTRANEITLRQLLSMTSGYQDYWPQDYVFTAMQSPTTADAILDRWAGQKLDFDPGTSWQYSNTNYVIAAAVVERVAGMPFMEFLRQRIFTPLRMTTVADFDAGPLARQDAGPYLRNAVGPLKLAPKEGKGWLFGAGQLAMTAHDLATWDLSMINQTVLQPASYRDLMTTMVLTGGTATGYGLGVNVGMAPGGRRRISHGGAVSGYTTTNVVFPDDKAAIVVLTNIYPGGGGASGQIASRIAPILLAATDSTDAPARELARRVYDGLAKGTIDRSLFTSNANDYFTAEVLEDYASSLGPLGAPTEFTSGGSSLRGGLRIRGYQIRTGSTVLGLTMMVRPDGKIEQYIVER